MDSIATIPSSRLEQLVTGFVTSVQPSPERIRRSIAALRRQRPNLDNPQLAERWAERVCRRYAAEGAASALPGVIPGLGTSAQFLLEGGTIAADLTYMLRCMADIVMGVGCVFGREIEEPFNEEFVRVLGIWCGALSIGKETAYRVGSKLALAQAKRVPKELLRYVKPRIGETLLTKLGRQRGSATLGRVVPFGIGVLLGGGFNYATMRAFKNATLQHYVDARVAA
jgi:hypothetical protein